MLHGREHETRALVAQIERAQQGRGGALLLRGAPGIGKSALLEHARAEAAGRDVNVLAATGTAPEQTLAFAALHHLLMPLIGFGATELKTALGLEPGTAPDLFRIALATLEVLAEAAPLVLLVDDLQWLDAPTADVLAFVTRRLQDEPIVLLGAIREADPSPLLSAGLPLLELQPLPRAAAATLLDQHANGMPRDLKARILADAAGNPLALVELPRSATDATARQWPLTERLERAFAGRVSALPTPTQALLLAAAADPSCPTELLVSATGAPPDALQPAIEAGIVDAQARFRHPLIASGVYQAAPLPARLATHAALATVLEDQPDRQVWHRAAATLGADDEVADALVAFADRARNRGAVMASAAALQRASALASTPARRTDLVLRAAEAAADLGRRDTATALLASVDPTHLDATARARRLAVRESVAPGDFSDPDRIATLTQAAIDADPETGTELLWRVAFRAWWGSAPEHLRAPIVTAAQNLPPSARRRAILAYADPSTPNLPLGGGDDDRYEAAAALILGDFPRAITHWTRAEALYRRQGRIALLVRIAVSLHYTRAWAGDWDGIETQIAEAKALARETGEAFWELAGDAAAAQWLAMRGDHEAAERTARAALTNPVARGARFIHFTAQLALAHAAAAANRPAEAYALLRQTFDPGSPMFHRDLRHWVFGDLAELAIRAGSTGDARALIAPLLRATTSPRIRLSHAHAAALLDPTDAAFTHARTQAPLPLDHARIELAYGTWLRRERRYSDSRPPLKRARATFAQLGATAWCERADAELIASGEVRRTPAAATRDELTPQERQIATLAAQGLTNREIAQHLFLSPRTVSTHLYRAYQKLGISSRAEL